MIDRPHLHQCEGKQATWHWMEVTGFFTFMFLAPGTILDNLQDAAIADRFEALEQKVQDLQGDLDNIDG